MSLAQAATVPCAGCSLPIDPGTAYYSSRGDVICASCNAKADLKATEHRSAGYIQSAAFGNLGLGAFALFVFNPFLLLSALAVANAAFVGTALLKDDWYRSRMGLGRFIAAVVSVLLGGLLGAVPLLAILVLKVLVLLS